MQWCVGFVKCILWFLEYLLIHLTTLSYLRFYTSNNRMIDEKWMKEDVEGSRRRIISVTLPYLVWENCGKPWRPFTTSGYCGISRIRNTSFISVDMKNQLDVTFCILYFSSNSCLTCFGQPCAHHQELTTAWCYSLVLVCAVAAGRLSRPVGR